VGKVTYEKKMLSYHKIYEQLCENPLASHYHLAKEAHLSRNTFSKYLHELYDAHMLKGPYLMVKPCRDHPYYLYLMNFSDPVKVFEGLKGFPHVIDHAVTFGEWDIQVVTDRRLDFSQLKGHENQVFEEKRGHTYVSHVGILDWEEAFQIIDEKIASFSPYIEKSHEELIDLNWSPDEWKLFWAFQENIRGKKGRVLKEIEVRHEVFSRWRKSLKKTCVIYTGFYPEGKYNCMKHCFLVRSAYGKILREIVDCMPVTCFLEEVGEYFMMSVYSISPKTSVKLFCLMYEMKAKRMVKEVKHASVIKWYG
jgi:hypothetical protein